MNTMLKAPKIRMDAATKVWMHVHARMPIGARPFIFMTENYPDRKRGDLFPAARIERCAVREWRHQDHGLLCSIETVRWGIRMKWAYANDANRGPIRRHTGMCTLPSTATWALT